MHILGTIFMLFCTATAGMPFVVLITASTLQQIYAHIHLGRCEVYCPPPPPDCEHSLPKIFVVQDMHVDKMYIIYPFRLNSIHLQICRYEEVRGLKVQCREISDGLDCCVIGLSCLPPFGVLCSANILAMGSEHSHTQDFQGHAPVPSKGMEGLRRTTPTPQPPSLDCCFPQHCGGWVCTLLRVSNLFFLSSLNAGVRGLKQAISLVHNPYSCCPEEKAAAECMLHAVFVCVAVVIEESGR